MDKNGKTAVSTVSKLESAFSQYADQFKFSFVYVLKYAAVLIPISSSTQVPIFVRFLWRHYVSPEVASYFCKNFGVLCYPWLLPGLTFNLREYLRLSQYWWQPSYPSSFVDVYQHVVNSLFCKLLPSWNYLSATCRVYTSMILLQQDSVLMSRLNASVKINFSLNLFSRVNLDI